MYLPKYVLIGFLSILFVALVLFLIADNGRNQRLERIQITATPIVLSPFPSSTPYPTSDQSINQITQSGSLQQCLDEANRVINEWRAQCKGPNCEGVDLVNDPRDECYKKYSPPITYAVGLLCQNNGQCGAGKFCYQRICRPYNYCLSNSDCSIGAECQRICQGDECNSAIEYCGTLSFLNKDYMYDCSEVQACKPKLIRCVNNGCQIVGQ